MATLGTFKIEGAKELDAEQLADILRKHLDPKFEVAVGKADKGVKKFVTGNVQDTVSIKKNAYHGVIISLSPKPDGMSYQALYAGMCVPNWMLDQVVGHEGILDRAICHLIFGKGNDLYDKLEEVMAAELGAQWVDTGLVNSVKSMVKGKTVFDDKK